MRIWALQIHTLYSSYGQAQLRSRLSDQCVFTLLAILEEIKPHSLDFMRTEYYIQLALLFVVAFVFIMHLLCIAFAFNRN